MTFRERTDTSWAVLFDAQITAGSRFYYRLSFFYLRNGGAAEEVCQQVYLKAWEQRAKLKSPAAMDDWIKVTIRNECCQVLRRRKTEKHAQQDIAADLVEGSVDRSLNDIEIRESLLLAIDDLPEKLRQVLLLHYLEELSGDDTAKRLGISASEASKRLKRGLEQLRIILRRPGFGWRE